MSKQNIDSSSSRCSSPCSKNIKAEPKKRAFDINTKVTFLLLLESGRSIQSIVMEFQVGETTIRDWKKIKDELYELEKGNNLALVPKNILRTSNYPEVDNALNIWFCHQRALNYPISIKNSSP